MGRRRRPRGYIYYHGPVYSSISSLSSGSGSRVEEVIERRVIRQRKPKKDKKKSKKEESKTTTYINVRDADGKMKKMKQVARYSYETFADEAGVLHHSRHHLDKDLKKAKARPRR